MKNWCGSALLSIALLSYFSIQTPSFAYNEASTEASTESASEAQSETGVAVPYFGTFYGYGYGYGMQPVATPYPVAPMIPVRPANPEIRDWNRSSGFARVFARRHSMMRVLRHKSHLRKHK